LLEVTELPVYAFFHFATHKRTYVYVIASLSTQLVDNRSDTSKVTGCSIHRDTALHHFETKTVIRGHFVFMGHSEFSCYKDTKNSYTNLLGN
jgi:hypothetical protein